DNAANDFVGALQLTGPVIAGAVRDANDLILAASNFGFGSLGETIQVTAGGNITQTGPPTSTPHLGTKATPPITSPRGSLTLTNANNFSPNMALALSVTGANTVTITNSPGANTALLLGNVTLGTGLLTLTSNGNIVQRAGTTIQTGGPITATIATNNHDVLL